MDRAFRRLAGQGGHWHTDPDRNEEPEVSRQRGVGRECEDRRWPRTEWHRSPGASEMFRRDFDAILFGAVGDPRIADQRDAAEILVALRLGLDLHAAVRPV